MNEPRLFAGFLIFVAAGCGGNAVQPPPPLTLQTTAVASAVPVASAAVTAPSEGPPPPCVGARRIGNMAFSPDGQSLVTACTAGSRECSDGTDGNAFIDVWSLPQGKLLRSLPTGMENIVTMLWGPGGLLATVANPTTGMCDVRLFNASTWTPRAGVEVYCVSGIDFNPVGSTLVIAGCDGEIRSLDTQSGKTADRPTAEAHLGGDYGVGVKFSGDGKALFVDDEYQGFQVLDPITLKRKRTVGAESRVQCSSYSPDRSKLAVRQEDGALKVMETKISARPKILAKHPPQTVCSSLAWVDATRFVLGLESGEITLWDTSGKGSSRTLSSPTDPLPFTALQVSPDGGSVAVVDRDGAILVWDLATVQKRELYRRPAPADGAAVLDQGHIQWSPGSDRLAAMFSGKLFVWDARTGQKKLETMVRAAMQYPSIEWSTNAGIVAVADETAHLVRAADGATLTLAVVDRGGVRVGIAGTDSGAYEGPPDLSSCVVPESVPLSKRTQRPGLLADMIAGRSLAQSP